MQMPGLQHPSFPRIRLPLRAPQVPEPPLRPRLVGSPLAIDRLNLSMFEFSPSLCLSSPSHGLALTALVAMYPLLYPASPDVAPSFAAVSTLAPPNPSAC
jgi:hypothetical protein